MKDVGGGWYPSEEGERELSLPVPVGNEGLINSAFGGQALGCAHADEWNATIHPVIRNVYRIPSELADRVALTDSDHTTAYYLYRQNSTALEGILAAVAPSEHVDDDFLHPDRRDELESRLSDLNTAFFRGAGESLDLLMRRWLVVMRVTITEVYLKDALTTLALFAQPSPARESSVTWSFRDVLDLSSTRSTLEAFCADWAKGIIDDRGGPAKWCKRLGKFARLSGVDVQFLEYIWGIRHAQVHESGAAGREFRRRHATAAILKGRVQVDEATLRRLWKESDALVDAVDAGIAGQLKAAMGEEAYAAFRAERDAQVEAEAEQYERDMDGSDDMLDMQAHNLIRDGGYQE